jgi:putative DNA primase/helicase
MSDFLSFARAHGIIIHSLPPIGVWRRYSTVDHPHRKNGAVKFMADHAFIQNHAIDTEVEVWHGQPPSGLDMEKINRLTRAAEEKKRQLQRDAANKAAGLLKQCIFACHPYLKKKGFPDERGNVYVKDGQQFLVIPMRRGSLVGAQVIDEEGGKKFLFGQASGGAEFIFDNKGPHIYVEGYATALSVRAAMTALKRRYTLHVCFSATNMARIAKGVTEGFVVADHDESGVGERIAKHIGLPYWMSDVPGEDANDAHQRMGLFRFSQALQKVFSQGAGQ